MAWSILVSLCGLATNFAQLVLIRVGVAVGEAGCNPPALSLIAEVFSRAERPQTISRLSSGGEVQLRLIVVTPWAVG